MRVYRINLLLILALLLTGCTAPTEGNIPIGDITPETPSSPTPTGAWLSSVETTPTPGPTLLRVWLPPFMNPGADQPAGRLLQSRLMDFQNRHPNVVIETRLKPLEGPGGLLDSLTTASAAAPASLPDLIALPRDLLEAAALKGLLLPFENLTTTLNDQDWYPYAIELGNLQNDLYGLPFAGDALVQVYHTDQITEPLQSWEALIDAQSPLIFSAARENALFTLVQYQALGGAVRDEQGRPFLNPFQLTEVLTFFQTAAQIGALPQDVITQLQNDDQAWEAFNQRRADQVVTWASRYLTSNQNGIAVSSIITPDGEPATLATGWVWALVGRDEEKRRLAVDLAEFLTDSHFLADWSQAAGFLPTRPSSLALWSDEELRQIIAEIEVSIHLLPPTDVLSSLKTPLANATLQVLQNQSDPTSAAQAAAASLTGP